MDDNEYDERLEAIQARVEKAVKGECFVEFSACEEDDDGVPVDNLDEVAWEGRCRFVQEGETFFGNGKGYRSEVLENPTWLQVAVLANEMIKATGDEHHVFLESVDDTGEEEGGVAIVEFGMGS
jgi:hypothetical protein